MSAPPQQNETKTEETKEDDIEAPIGILFYDSNHCFIHIQNIIKKSL